MAAAQATLIRQIPQIRALELCSPRAASRGHKEELRQPSALTTQEVIPVMLATVRESYGHRRWPTEVIAGFLAAEVIAPRCEQ
ncbi:MAG: hypothetical protein ABJB97_03615 [Acidobacteriota bacterium]